MKARRTVSCPHCRSTEVDTVVSAPYIRGRLLRHRRGNKRLVGCRRCVRKLLAAEVGGSLVGGWFSPVALFVNPFYLLWNGLRLPFLQRDPEAVERLLGDLGICAELVDLSRVAASLAVTMVAADGKTEVQEIETAISLGEELVEGFSRKLFYEAMDNVERLPSTTQLAAMLASVLEEERKAAVLKYLLAIAAADGRIDDSEIVELQAAASAMGIVLPGMA